MAPPTVVDAVIAPVDGPVRASEPMCAYAFDVVCNRLGVARPGPRAAYPGSFPDSVPDASGVGVFVTFNTRSGAGDWELRGCIGTLAPTDLRPALQRYAAYAAFDDRRFSAIEATELHNLQAAVSVLSNFVRAEGGVYDWTVGVHGIILDLYPHGPRGEKYSATYLPEVCAEQGWSKEQCITSLARKSGFRGQLTPAVLESAELTTYVSTKASITYSDYASS